MLIGTLIILSLASIPGLYAFKAYKRAIAFLNSDDVMTLRQAFPVYHEKYEALLEDLARLAGIPAPTMYVYQAELPNAFVMIEKMHPVIFVSDEVLRRAEQTKGSRLDYLVGIIAHELGHLACRHGRRHLLWSWLLAISGRLRWRGLRLTCLRQLRALETEADNFAARIVNRFHVEVR